MLDLAELCDSPQSWRALGATLCVSQTVAMMARAMMKSMVAASHSVLSNIDAPAAEIQASTLRNCLGSGKDMTSLPNCHIEATTAWLCILDAIERLQAKVPAEGEKVHWAMRRINSTSPR